MLVNALLYIIILGSSVNVKWTKIKANKKKTKDTEKMKNIVTDNFLKSCDHFYSIKS